MDGAIRFNSSLRQVSGPEFIEGQTFETVFPTYSGRTALLSCAPFKPFNLPMPRPPVQ